MSKFPQIPGYNIFLKYIHGSEDSLDKDVIYVIDKMPDYETCQAFCSCEEENRNLVVLKDGRVVESFKGSPDEVNNGIFYTYNKHRQENPLYVIHPVHRDIPLKQIKVIRCILSLLSRTKYRPEIKTALNEGWFWRLNTLRQIKLDDSILPLNKNKEDRDVIKTIAFQLGQGLGLLDDEDLYTKSAVAKKYPLLKPYLYREDSNLDNLNEMLVMYLEKLKELEVEEEIGGNTTFTTYKKTYNVRNEELV